MFLIHIIKQQITYHDEPHEIAYIKDVTFGVLYEQSKAQDYLQSMIIKTCEQRVSLPLGTMVKCCTKLQGSNELKLIERHNPESTLRRELQIMKQHSKQIIFSFKDMMDWQSFKINKFEKKSIGFNLQEKMDEVISMMRFKAENQGIQLIYDPMYLEQNEETD